MDKLTASRISGGNSATGRRKSDFYPTPPEATIALLKYLRLLRCTRIWEPAAGEGDMAAAMRECGYTVYESDIATGTDFLKSDLAETGVKYDWIITNPPFSEAEAFIRRAWRIGKPFAFLLKAQFWHAGKRRQLFEECTPTLILPLTWQPDFFFKERAEGEKGSPLMDVQWCVWNPNNLHRAGTMYWPLARPNGGR